MNQEPTRWHDHVPPPETKAEAAVALAAKGFNVFPLHTPDGTGRCSCGDADCKSPGKHPRTPRGLKDATTNLQQITQWWTRWPDANIGIACGAASGLIALDVDGSEGEASLARLTEAYGPLPATLQVITGRGRQLYYNHPGEKVRSAAPINPDFPQLDSRGDGGYVIAPPSVHFTGREYTYDETAPSAIAEAPEWLVQFVNTKSRSNGAHRHRSAANDDGVREGGRNTWLTSEAGRLRRAGKSVDEIDEVLQPLNEKYCEPPLDPDEVRRIAESVGQYEPSDEDALRKSLTDMGNARRFARLSSHRMRYVPELGSFIVWVGTHWDVDRAGAAIEQAKAVSASIYDEGNTVLNADLRVEIAQFARRSAGEARLNAMLNLARSEPQLVLPVAELDTHRGLLPVQNGTVDLARGVLLPSRREDFSTMVAPVTFDAGAECPLFRTFVYEIMDGNQELVDFLQRVFGYALSGYTDEQCLFFAYGTGANGKSTMFSILREIMGHRYHLVMPSEALMARQGGGGATPELARLPGARVVVTNEVEDGSFLAESLVKLMTGEDRISARHLYQAPFEFVPQFKLFMIGNHKPVIRGDDYGIWRRIVLIPFLVTIPPDRRDPELATKLRGELPGILNWALEGYRTWRTRKLAPPAAVTDAVEEYKQEMDIFGQWVDECCDVHPVAETSAYEAYHVFKNWCGLNGLKVWTNVRFGRKAGERYVRERTPKGNIVYRGFRIKPSMELLRPRL
jgi:putative DNA primase/helicase